MLKSKYQNPKIKNTFQNPPANNFLARGGIPLWREKFVIWICLVICALVLVICTDGFAQPVSSTDLINSAKLYDGKAVVYAGEVIGDVMVRHDFAWVNVNDGKNAIGIWLPRRLTKEIVYAGSYKSKGDWVQVTGVFNHACPEHGGDLDIHALTLAKVASGRQILEKLNSQKRNQVFILLGALCLILILSQFIKK